MQKTLISDYKMINVGDKTPTQRTCIATGKLLALAPTILRIKNGDLPKGNVLPMAETAGIMAVKKTSDTLPLCHPLPIDAAYVRFEFHENAVQVFCEVTAHAKTGVEMEALNGVSAALLCIYDLTKGIDPALEISSFHLVSKEGGKSGMWSHPKATPHSPALHSSHTWSDVNLSVITLSDRCANGTAEDTSGPKIVEYAKALGATLFEYKLLPDEPALLKEKLVEYCDSHKTNLVITTGGTGLSPRDITPETIQALGAKIVPGLGELIRKAGSAFTANAWLSRSEGFLLKDTLIVCLPGSFKAVKESLEAIEKIIPHALQMARGDHHSPSHSLNTASSSSASSGDNRS